MHQKGVSTYHVPTELNTLHILTGGHAPEGHVQERLSDRCRSTACHPRTLIFEIDGTEVVRDEAPPARDEYANRDSLIGIGRLPLLVSSRPRLNIIAMQVTTSLHSGNPLFVPGRGMRLSYHGWWRIS